MGFNARATRVRVGEKAFIVCSVANVDYEVFYCLAHGAGQRMWIPNFDSESPAASGVGDRYRSIAHSVRAWGFVDWIDVLGLIVSATREVKECENDELSEPELLHAAILYSFVAGDPAIDKFDDASALFRDSKVVRHDHKGCVEFAIEPP